MRQNSNLSKCSPFTLQAKAQVICNILSISEY